MPMAPDGRPKFFRYHGCAVQANSPGNGGRRREFPLKRRRPRLPQGGFVSSALLFRPFAHAIDGVFVAGGLGPLSQGAMRIHGRSVAVSIEFFQGREEVATQKGIACQLPVSDRQERFPIFA